MVTLKVLLVASIGGLVTAWPEPTPAANLEHRAVNCAEVTGALAILKNLGPPATTFCRSYLKVPGTSTITTTTTPTAVTSTTSTTTVEVTSAACPPSRKRSVIYHHKGVGIVSLEEERVEKRTDVLALLGAFAAAKISEGCSCLNLQPTLTMTATLTVPAPTVNVVATSTNCVVAPPTCGDAGASCTLGPQCCSGLCFLQSGDTIVNQCV